MRILTFLHSFETGGVERIALRLVRAWREGGVDAPLFIGHGDGDMRSDVGAGLAFDSPRRPPWLKVGSWETLWMILTLPRTVRRLRPDILFCAGNTYAIIAVALKLRLGRNCPPILAKVSNDLDRRDKPLWRRALYRLWLRTQGRFIDHFVGMETPMTDEIGERLVVARERIAIIPDPALSRALIDRLRTMPRIAPSMASGRQFVAVGRLAPQKNLSLMLRAFARGRREGDRLTLIGDGPERPRLEALAELLGIGRNVEFRGYVANPALLLPAFDILLLSSTYEGVPAVILEALAARLPIIATDCSRSMPALLRDGALGMLIDVGDEIAFADAIAGAKPGRQDAAASLAQAERFTIERASDAYLATMAALGADRAVCRNFVQAN